MTKRDAVVNLLATKPMTVSEIATTLHVPRQLVHHHLRRLLRDGVVFVKDVVKTNGRYRSRVYSLRDGITLVTIKDPGTMRHTLLWLENYYIKHIKNLPKAPQHIDNLRNEFILFMYQVMRVCSELVGLDQHGLLRLYGERLAKDVVVPLALAGDANDNHSGSDLFKRTVTLVAEITSSSHSIFNGKTTQSIIHFKGFLGSDRYDSRIDEFILSVLQTAAQSLMRGKVLVEKFPQNRSTSYTYLVRRADVKQF
ncbi:MAG: winged helix-turn-helix domain-containing protein [Candidatus Caldarchaeum sp.]